MYSDDMNFTETFISGHASQNNITTADIDSKTSTDGSTGTSDDLDTDTSDNTETQFYTPISGSVESESGRELEKRYNTKYQTTQGLQKSRSISNIEEITELSIEKTVKEFSSSGSTFNFNFYQTSVSTSHDVTVGTSNRLTTEGQLIENKREENEDTLYDNQRKVQNNITSDTVALIEEERHQGTYVRTRAFDKARDILRTHGFTIITGYPGDGKTSLGMELLAHFRKGDEYTSNKTPVYLTDTYEWRHVNNRSNVIVLFECRVSQSSDLRKNLELINILYANRLNEVLVVVTFCKFLLVRLEAELTHKYKFLKTDFVIDLSSNGLRINCEEKYSILFNHLRNARFHVSKGQFTTVTCSDHVNAIEEKSGSVLFPTSVIDAVSKNQLNFPFGYPSCCKMFVTKINLLKKGQSFFTNPVEWLCLVLNEFRHDTYDEIKYNLLVCILFSSRKGLPKQILRPSYFFTEPHLKSFQEFLKLKNIPFRFCFQAIYFLLDVFISYDKKTKSFHFLNEGIQEATFLSYGQDNPRKLLDQCTIKALMNFFSTTDSFGIKIPPTDHQVFFKRLVTEIKNGNLFPILHHQDFSHGDFVTNFFAYLKQMNLETIFLQKRKGNTQSSLYQILSTSEQTVNYKLFERVLEIFVRPNEISCLPFSFLSDEWKECQIYSCLYYASVYGDLHLYNLLIDKVVHVNEAILTNLSSIEDDHLFTHAVNYFAWPTETIQRVQQNRVIISTSDFPNVSKDIIYHKAILAYEAYPLVEKKCRAFSSGRSSFLTLF